MYRILLLMFSLDLVYESAHFFLLGTQFLSLGGLSLHLNNLIA